MCILLNVLPLASLSIYNSRFGPVLHLNLLLPAPSDVFLSSGIAFKSVTATGQPTLDPQYKL